MIICVVLLSIALVAMLVLVIGIIRGVARANRLAEQRELQRRLIVQQAQQRMTAATRDTVHQMNEVYLQALRQLRGRP